jgi:rhodanese-related sulfurtransferase
MKIFTLIVIIVILGFIFYQKNNLIGLANNREMQNISLENSLVVDVRTESEYNAGHFSPSINIPVDEIEKFLDVFKTTEKENIILVCRSGGRAGRAQALLQTLVPNKNYINAGAWQNLENWK